MIHTLEIGKRINWTLYDSLYKLSKVVHGNDIEFTHIYERTIDIESRAATRVSIISQRDNSAVCYLKIIINPAFFGGNALDSITSDESTVFNAINEVIDAFNRRCNTEFTINDFELYRVDYAVQIEVDEKDRNMYMKLFRKCDVPKKFVPRVNRDSKSHKVEFDEGSIYFKSKSININFYDKTQQLDGKGKSTEKSLIRLEVQHKKLGNLKRDYKVKRSFDLINKEIAYKEIVKFYEKTIGFGDYYSFAEAKKIISNSDISQNKKSILLNTLRLISSKKGIYFVKKEMKGDSIKLDEQIRELNRIGINPVIISKKNAYLDNLLKHDFDEYRSFSLRKKYAINIIF